MTTALHILIATDALAIIGILVRDYNVGRRFV